MMKKLIALLLALVMVLSLVACGAKETPAADAPAADAPAADAPAADKPADAPAADAPAADAADKEEVAIEVWVAQVDWADAWDVMEAKFEEEYPWIDVQHVGLGETDFVTTRLAANDLPAIIQQNNSPVMDQLVADGLLVDLTNYDCAQYMAPTYADAFTKDGKLIGMCQGAAFSTMFYNMAILEEAGWTEPPATWDELLQCCADIEAKTEAAPLVTAAGKTTTSWMILELVLANLLNDADAVAAYQEDFMNGTFDWAAVEGLAERMDAIAPYFLTGTATAHEEDAANYMADGLAAMCLCGNWNGTMLVDAIETAGGVPACTLPPFGDGTTTWISNSPEDAFCVTVNEKRSKAEQEAVDTFFNWMFKGENFMLIQNARGTVPVLGSMTEEHIVLPESIGGILADMNAAPYVKMGFNVYTAVFRDTVVSALCEFLGGGVSAEEIVDLMWQTEQKDYFYN